MSYRVVLLCLLVVLGVTMPVAAQNLVDNGDFDLDVSSWTPISVVDFQWEPLDSQSDPSSGSGLAANTGNAGSNSGITQCIESIEAGRSYELSAWLDISPSQSGEGNAKLFVWWRDEPGCTGTQSTALATPYTVTTSGWELRSAPAEVAPAGTVSATLYLNVVKSSMVADTFYVSFDDIDLRIEGSLFFDGFESSDTSAWSAVTP